MWVGARNGPLWPRTFCSDNNRNSFWCHLYSPPSSAFPVEFPCDHSLFIAICDGSRLQRHRYCWLKVGRGHEPTSRRSFKVFNNIKSDFHKIRFSFITVHLPFLLDWTFGSSNNSLIQSLVSQTTKMQPQDSDPSLNLAGEYNNNERPKGSTRTRYSGICMIGNYFRLCYTDNLFAFPALNNSHIWGTSA